MTMPLVQATGRRKRAVARVRVRAGQGRIVINGREIEDYFPSPSHRSHATEALAVTDTAAVYDVDATISGGGLTGQAGALRLGIARSLERLDGDSREKLKRAGLLTRDPRKKESKKYGLKKARKAPQYSKR
ncbi:MAG: 30S ribosomal protein S9 [Acidimicrobiia bacterium]|nr:30S ribosomal protein S9 [Acidimicrobiia bacterium]MYB24859.1 30S ribosomal protein S9 [Acidimicrobiia bacterium]MYJ14884.1 30S ribosomal protein S9 [Acidimicrobiia bacterium]